MLPVQVPDQAEAQGFEEIERNHGDFIGAMQMEPVAFQAMFAFGATARMPLILAVPWIELIFLFAPIASKDRKKHAQWLRVQLHALDAFLEEVCAIMPQQFDLPTFSMSLCFLDPEEQMSVRNALGTIFGLCTSRRVRPSRVMRRIGNELLIHNRLGMSHPDWEAEMALVILAMPIVCWTKYGPGGSEEGNLDQMSRDYLGVFWEPKQQ